MKRPYLEVTYRRGKPLAAYWYLPRKREDRATRTEEAEAGLLIDYAADGRPIGIEMTSPANTSAEALNRILRGLGVEAINDLELTPLRAAS